MDFRGAYGLIEGKTRKKIEKESGGRSTKAI
jgi:hypothetical protein